MGSWLERQRREATEHSLRAIGYGFAALALLFGLLFFVVAAGELFIPLLGIGTAVDQPQYGSFLIWTGVTIGFFFCVYIGLKLTVTRSEKTIGSVLLGVGIVLLAVLLWGSTTRASSSNAQSLAPLFSAASFLIYVGMGKILGQNIRGVDRNALSPEENGTMGKSAKDFMLLMLAGLVAFIGIGVVAFLVLMFL